MVLERSVQITVYFCLVRFKILEDFLQDKFSDLFENGYIYVQDERENLRGKYERGETSSSALIKNKYMVDRKLKNQIDYIQNHNDTQYICSI